MKTKFLIKFALITILLFISICYILSIPWLIVQSMCGYPYCFIIAVLMVCILVGFYESGKSFYNKK